jgi:hypothetical protein
LLVPFSLIQSSFLLFQVQFAGVGAHGYAQKPVVSAHGDQKIYYYVHIRFITRSYHVQTYLDESLSIPGDCLTLDTERDLDTLLDRDLDPLGLPRPRTTPDDEA